MKSENEIEAKFNFSQILKVPFIENKTDEEKQFLIESLSFTFKIYLIDMSNIEEKSYSTFKTHAEGISTKLKELQKLVSYSNNEELNMMFLGLTGDFRDQFFTDDSLGNRIKVLPGAYSDIFEPVSECFSLVETNQKLALNTIVNNLSNTIEKNISKDSWRQHQGKTPATRHIRILIAKVAGIFSIIGGNDSRGENSEFVLLIQEIFNILDLASDPASIIKRAKEENFYSNLKKSPFPIDSRFYAIADSLGTNNHQLT
jgi:hypothetical protein